MVTSGFRECYSDDNADSRNSFASFVNGTVGQEMRSGYEKNDRHKKIWGRGAKVFSSFVVFSIYPQSSLVSFLDRTLENLDLA